MKYGSVQLPAIVNNDADDGYGRMKQDERYPQRVVSPAVNGTEQPLVAR